MTESNALQTVKNNIKQFVGTDDKITVALSGGADSVCLLHMLKKLNYNISAVHINHGIRGNEAQRDEDFCVNLCKRLGVDLDVVKIDVPGNLNGRSVELAARQMRYDVFAGYALVATAHNASDNLETVIYNIARGSGLKGAGGIPEKIQKDNTLFVRPILSLTRQDVEDYCSQNAIEYVTDSTNNDDFCTRNKIRHLIVPQIKQNINQKAEQSVLRLCESLKNDNELLEQLAKNEYEKLVSDNCIISCKKLLQLPKALSSRIILSLVEDADFKTVVDILELAENTNPSAFLTIAQGVTARREYDKIFFSKQKINVKFEPQQLNEGKNRLSNGKIIVLDTNNTDKIYSLLTNMFVNLDKIEDVLIARGRKIGDKIVINNMSKSIKKVMIDNKIPQILRDSLPIIECGGKIVCAFGVGVDDNFKANNKNERILYIEYKG